jgi:DNA repair protein RadC
MSTDLYIYDADGLTRTATQGEILDAARSILARRVRRGRALSNPRHTRDFLRLELASRDHEIFAILFLDNRHRVIEFVPLFRGTIDGASVHPREVVKEALARNAAAVILAHNHPSGVAEPSQADELITRRLRDALA